MKTLNVSLDEEAHKKLIQIKEALGHKNLNDTLSEMISRFKLNNNPQIELGLKHAKEGKKI